MRVSDIDGVALDDKGRISDAKERTKAIQAEWSDFIEMREVKGANTPEEVDYIESSDHPFTGSYNGNGFNITGLTDNTSGVILFGTADGANRYNVTFINDETENAAFEVTDFVCKK